MPKSAQKEKEEVQNVENDTNKKVAEENTAKAKKTTGTKKKTTSKTESSTKAGGKSQAKTTSKSASKSVNAFNEAKEDLTVENLPTKEIGSKRASGTNKKEVDQGKKTTKKVATKSKGKKTDAVVESQKEEKKNVAKEKIKAEKVADAKNEKTDETAKENTEENGKKKEKQKEKVNKKEKQEKSKKKKAETNKEKVDSKKENKENAETNKEEATEKAVVEKEHVKLIKFEEIKNIFKKKKAIPKEELKKINKPVFTNILVAVGIMIYFIFLILGFYHIGKEAYQTDLKVFALCILFLAIILLENAYKKDSGKIAIFGIEMIVLAVITVGLIYVNLMLSSHYINVVTITSYIITIYYVIKAIVVYQKGKNKYFVDDMKEIMNTDE